MIDINCSESMTFHQDQSDMNFDQIDQPIKMKGSTVITKAQDKENTDNALFRKNQDQSPYQRIAYKGFTPWREIEKSLNVSTIDH